MTPQDLRQRLEAAGITVTLLDLVAESDIAAALGVSTRTVQRKRERGEGPEATRIFGRWFYSLEAIADHLDSSSTSASARQHTTKTERQQDEISAASRIAPER